VSTRVSFLSRSYVNVALPGQGSAPPPPVTIHTTEAVHPSGREHWRKMVVERYFLDVNVDVAAAQCVCLACSVPPIPVVAGFFRL
jgi:hypothetical protein